MFKEYTNISILKDKIISKIEQSINEKSRNDVLIFYVNNKKYYMEHFQDCCENVYIESIDGNLEDLLNSTILQAEEINSTEPYKENKSVCHDDSFTWTFYKLATIKGYVTIRWFGTSNGYYSEDVSFYYYDHEDEKLSDYVH